MSNNFIELPSSPTDAISSVAFSPNQKFLLVGSWDCAIHVYIDIDGVLQLHSRIGCDAPVLDIDWNSDNVTFYAVGLDHEVVKYNVTRGEESRTVLSSHSQPTNKVAFSASLDILISTSWDGTMHVHNPGTASYICIQLEKKPFALSLTSNRALVAMAERKVHVFNLQDLKTALERNGSTADSQKPIKVEPWQQRESSLKFMTRDVACMPNGAGFASSSIEGRVGVEFFDEEENKQSYAFKCHRDKTTLTTAAEDGEEEAVAADMIYPVNAITFHPLYGTFATGGGDGTVVLWDAKTKRRIRHYTKLPASISALNFSADGQKLAVCISPGFEDGRDEQGLRPDQVKVYVREFAEGEAKGKPSKKDKTEAEA